jgi:hypothetical protein
MALTYEQSETVDDAVEQAINLVLDDPNVTLEEDVFTVSVETRMRIRGVLVDVLEEEEYRHV